MGPWEFLVIGNRNSIPSLVDHLPDY